MVVGIVLWLSAIVLWEKRLVQQLRAADYKLCPHCGYSLKGHESQFESQFKCPECATACDIDKIQYDWRSFRPLVIGGGGFIRNLDRGY